MKHEPRPYQRACGNDIYLAWRTHRRVLAELATGLGKSYIIGMIAANEAKHGRRTLCIVHREELITQLHSTMVSMFGLDCSIEKAQDRASLSHSVVVGSVQSMAGQRLERFSENHFDVVVADEAHHSVCDGWKAILDRFEARTVGFTATGYRGDRKSLGSIFTDVAYVYNLHDGIKDGWLSPIVAETIPLEIDLSSVKTTQGDYDKNELDSAITPYVASMIETVHEKAPDRNVLSFWPLIKTSQLACEIANRIGFKAEHVDGKSPDRRQIIDRFKSGETKFLCNSNLLTEGADIPRTDCILVGRPTRSTGLYTQMLGRGVRLFEGKEDCYVPDFLWLTGKHKLIRPVNLAADDEEVAAEMQKQLDKGGAVNIDELEQSAGASVSHERENKLAQFIEENKHKAGKIISIEDFGSWCDAEGLADFGAGNLSSAKDKLPASKSDLARLERHHLPHEGITRGYAKAICKVLDANQEKGLPTPRQAACLTKHKYDPKNYTFETASQLITKLAKNWK